MRNIKTGLAYALVVLAIGCLCAWPTAAPAQTTEPPTTGVTDPPPETGVTDPPDTGVTDPPPADGTAEDPAPTPDAAKPPAYITELMKATGLQQTQVDQMLAAGYGWGEVRIAALLAQRLAANSTADSAFADALAQVMAARAEGKGFGQIAAENNLKIGDLVGQRKAGDAKQGPAAQKGAATQQRAAAQNGSAVRKGEQAQAHVAAQEKKPGFFARVRHFFGFGQSANKPVKAARVEPPQTSAQAVQSGKPEQPVRMERGVQVDRPERPEKPAAVDRPERPERPERPARPERPDRPERPERGPRR